MLLRSSSTCVFLVQTVYTPVILRPRRIRRERRYRGICEDNGGYQLRWSRRIAERLLILHRREYFLQGLDQRWNILRDGFPHLVQIDVKVCMNQTVPHRHNL